MLISSTAVTAAVVSSTTAGKIGLALTNAGTMLGALSGHAILADASSGSLRQILGPVMLIVASLLFITGCIVLGQGFIAMKQGENGWFQIVGGLGVALAGPIIGWFFNRANYGNAVISPTE
jgi:hypothetical protein